MANFQKSKIGILGGSFDPAHRGHLFISKTAIKKEKLSKVYWVVTKKNPFKKESFFPLKDRLQKAKKLVKKNRKIKILYLENKIKSSRSIDAINFILKKEKNKNLYFIVGSDILLNFHKWKRWKRIVKLTKLIVFSRRGYDRKSVDSIVVKYLNKNKIIFIKNKPVRVSSTALRNKIKKNN